MPLNIAPRDRKLLLGAFIVFILLIVGVVVLGGEQGEKVEIPSSYSTASGGAKAGYLLLAQSGYEVRRWERPLTDLPQAAGTTLILADPDEAPTLDERESIKSFLYRGGRIIATGMFSGIFLPDNDSVPDVLLGVSWKRASAVSPSAITRAAPQITIAPQARWPSYSPAYALYGDGEEVVVVKYPYGRGEVFWWAAATPLTNAGLKEPGNLEFLLACMGDTKAPIFWNEYIHGYRETLGSSVGQSPVKWLLLQLALLGLAVLATFSRRSGPVFAPVTDVRLSPLEFVQTLGGLYENADTASVAVDISYQRLRYWLTRRLGVAANIPLKDLEAAVHERFGQEGDRFAAILRRCEAAKSDPYLSESEGLHLVQELDQYASRWKLFEGRRKEKDA